MAYSLYEYSQDKATEKVVLQKNNGKYELHYSKPEGNLIQTIDGEVLTKVLNNEIPDGNIFGDPDVQLVFDELKADILALG